MIINSKIKREVLRYLGYRGQELDEITEAIVDESIGEMRSIVDKRYDYKFIDIARDGDRLWLENTNLELRGRDIKNHLENSDRCILLAVTLGHEVDRKIRYYEKISMDRALILDACASAFIEEAADEICEDIDKGLGEKGKTLTSRFSPGYGDFPLDIQGTFLSVMGTESSIGLTSTYSSILIPRKSITAIIGIVDIGDKGIEYDSCSTCSSYPTCIYSKGDRICES